MVTGASSGIGAATAEALAAAGVRVAATGRDPGALDAVVARMAAAGAPAGIAIPADLLHAEAPAAIVAEAVAGFGGLDILVSNAGAGWAGPFTEMTGPEITDLIALNLSAPVLLARAALPHLMDGGGGHLVVVGSIAGHLGVAREVVYSAAKAGLIGLTDALRAEMDGAGVTVTLVTPGVVDTAFFSRRNRPYERDRPRPVPPAEVADAVVDCLRHGRPDAVVPAWLGVPIRVHGAFPRLYRRLAGRFG